MSAYTGPFHFGCTAFHRIIVHFMSHDYWVRSSLHCLRYRLFHSGRTALGYTDPKGVRTCWFWAMDTVRRSCGKRWGRHTDLFRYLIDLGFQIPWRFIFVASYKRHQSTMRGCSKWQGSINTTVTLSRVLMRQQHHSAAWGRIMNTNVMTHPHTLLATAIIISLQNSKTKHRENNAEHNYRWD